MREEIDTPDLRLAKIAARQHGVVTVEQLRETGIEKSVISRRGRRLLTTHRHSIPVTTIQRTVDDLDGTVPPRLLRRAKRQAEHRGIHLEGTERRRARSDLEEDFFALVHRHHLPLPETNVKLGRHEVDFLWREQRVIVETDSFIYHRGSVSFEDDHARDLDLRRLDYTVLRFTDKQVEEEPDRVVSDVARALSTGPRPG